MKENDLQDMQQQRYNHEFTKYQTCYQKKKKKMEHNLLVEIIKSHYHLEKMRQIYQTIVLNQIRDLLTWRENCQGILNSDKIT